MSNDMKLVFGACVIVLVCLVGGWIGYAEGVRQTHQEAVANNVGQYLAIDHDTVEFVWNRQ